MKETLTDLVIYWLVSHPNGLGWMLIGFILSLLFMVLLDYILPKTPTSNDYPTDSRHRRRTRH